MSERKKGHNFAAVDATEDVVSTHTSIWAAKNAVRILTANPGLYGTGPYEVRIWENGAWIKLEDAAVYN